MAILVLVWLVMPERIYAQNPNNAELFLQKQQAVLSKSCAAWQYLRTKNIGVAMIELMALQASMEAFAEYVHQQGADDGLLQSKAMDALANLQANIDKAVAHFEDEALDEARMALEGLDEGLRQLRQSLNLYSHSDAFIPLFAAGMAFYDYVRQGPDFTDSQQTGLFMMRLGAYELALNHYLSHMPASHQNDAQYQRLIEILKRDLTLYQQAYREQTSWLVVNVSGELVSAIRILRFNFC